MTSLRDDYESALRLYGASPKTVVEVRFGEAVLPFHAALVEGTQLSMIYDGHPNGEYHAAKIGTMFFISRDMPEAYQRFVAFHELLEDAVDGGFMLNDMTKHDQALTVEVGYAKATLSEEAYQDYLAWRKGVEGSDYFASMTDDRIQVVSGMMGTIFESLPKHIKYGMGIEDILLRHTSS